MNLKESIIKLSDSDEMVQKTPSPNVSKDSSWILVQICVTSVPELLTNIQNYILNLNWSSDSKYYFSMSLKNRKQSDTIMRMLLVTFLLESWCVINIFTEIFWKLQHEWKSMENIGKVITHKWTLSCIAISILLFLVNRTNP